MPLGRLRLSPYRVRPRARRLHRPKFQRFAGVREKAQGLSEFRAQNPPEKLKFISPEKWVGVFFVKLPRNPMGVSGVE
jgi:hypothetical protein